MTLTPKIKNILWSAAVFIPSGLVCLGYVLYKRDFAKSHIEFSGLNFPIFIGEILLFFCSFLLVLRWLRNRPVFFQSTKINWFYAAAAVYSAWLIFKIVFGYLAWGPLSFRHAALFYYPLFFVIGYVFFKRELFTRWSIPLFLGCIIAVFVFRNYDIYWTLTLMLLGMILILRTQEKKWRIVMAVVLLLSVPYIFLFKIPRMMFVANMVSILFLIACTWHLLNIRLYVKLAGLAIVAAALGFGFYKFFVLGESGRVFVSPAKVISALKEMDKDVQRKKYHYEREPLAVGLYHSPNSASRSYHYYNRDAQNILLQEDDSYVFSIEDNLTFAVDGQDKNESPALVKIVSGKAEGPRPVVQEESVASSGETPTVVVYEEPPMPVEWASLNNIVFRLFIWRDMFVDWKEQGHPLLGIDFGRPLRSVSLEVLNWCEEEWNRDGWIEPHNSFLHMLYRGGVVGAGVVVLICLALVQLLLNALKLRSWTLILLCAILINWLVAANFLLILELPYTAIPFWLIAGMSWAYAHAMMKDKKGEA